MTFGKISGYEHSSVDKNASLFSLAEKKVLF